MKHVALFFITLMVITACGPEDLEVPEGPERPELVDSIPHHIVIRSHQISKGETYELQ